MTIDDLRSLTGLDLAEPTGRVIRHTIDFAEDECAGICKVAGSTTIEWPIWLGRSFDGCYDAESSPYTYWAIVETHDGRLLIVSRDIVGGTQWIQELTADHLQKRDLIDVGQRRRSVRRWSREKCIEALLRGNHDPDAAYDLIEVPCWPV